MKKLVILALGSALLLTLLALLPLHAAASSNVGTVTFADLGQGVWGGGPLNADGTVGGGVSYSIGNGTQVGKIVQTTWSFVNEGTAVNLCFIVQPIKGPPPFPSGCIEVPVTGTPVLIESGTTLVRVTLH